MGNDECKISNKKCPTLDKGSPFLKCVVSLWALPVWEGGVKACQDGLGHFFPMLPGGVRACQDGLGHFFLRLPVRKRGEGSKAMPI